MSEFRYVDLQLEKNQYSPRRMVRLKGSASDRSVMSMIESAGGSYDEETLQFLKKILKPDSVSIDIGANIGAVALNIAHLSPQGKVYAFEPGKQLYECLAENALNSGLANIETVNAAVTETTKTLSFSFIPEFAGGSFTSEQIQEGESEIVQGIALDEWVKAKRLQKVDFIKIDIEGSEIAALLGAKETLTRLRPDLLVECNPQALRRFAANSPKQLFELLRSIYPRIYFRDRLIVSASSLRSVLAEENIVNLYCTFRSMEKPLRTLIKSYAPSAYKLYLAMKNKNLTHLKSERRFVLEPDYQLTLLSEFSHAPSNERTSVRLKVKNTSRYVYSSAHHYYPVNITYQWLDTAKKTVVKDGIRSKFLNELAPGKTAEVVAHIVTPPIGGTYFLRISLVQENVHWFYEANPSVDFLSSVLID